MPEVLSPRVPDRDPHRDSPLHPDTHRSIYIGIGVELMLAALTYILRTPFICSLTATFGAVMIVRGVFPAWFCTHIEAQILAGTPYRRRESPGKWAIFITSAVAIASLFAWGYSKYAAPSNVADMSDAQLIKHTHDTARSLRDFQLHMWGQTPKAGADFESWNTEMRKEFTPLIAEAQVLNLELCHRLRRPVYGAADLEWPKNLSMTDIEALTVLDSQMPVGANPGGSVATYLDELAAQLGNNKR